MKLAMAGVWLALWTQAAPPPDPLAEELKATWTSALDLCRDGNKEALEKFIGALRLTREELTGLFGAEKAERIWPRWEETWKKLPAEASADLIERYTKTPWDDVQVILVSAIAEKDRSPEDRGVLQALRNKDAKVYNVRLKKKDQPEGLLLRAFVKTEGGWRMGLKIGRHLGDEPK